MIPSNLDIRTLKSLTLTVDVGNLFGWAFLGCCQLRQALIARNDEGICQARHSGQVLAGTLRPAPSPP